MTTIQVPVNQAATRITAAMQVLHKVTADASLRSPSPAHAPFSNMLPEGNLAPHSKFNPSNRKAGTAAELSTGAMFFYTNMIRMPRATGRNNPQKRTGLLVYGALATALAFPHVKQLKWPDKDKRKSY